MARNESRTLRERSSDLRSSVDQTIIDPAMSSPVLGKTITENTYPTGAGKYYAIQVLRPGGTENENENATFDPATGTIYAINIGASVPPEGTKVVLFPIKGRYVFFFS